jgi:ABC-2 type transport system ATP-binding protein
VSDLMIDADQLSISFGSVTALDHVSIGAARGSVLGLLGHNGAGKTTLVNILTTLLARTAARRRSAASTSSASRGKSAAGSALPASTPRWTSSCPAGTTSA